MIFVENIRTDPYQNLALEQWLMDHFDEDSFILWRTQKSIILGKNQNIYTEINLPYATTHPINIVRRATGGGTIFADDGNLMYTFISCNKAKDFTDFQKFTAPIINALQTLGVPAEFGGRNDLLVDGKKISGNAQCRYKNKVLHHGTLMYKVNTAELAHALNVRKIKLQGKGIQSVKSRVANICDYMTQQMDIEDFQEFLFKNVMDQVSDAVYYRLTDHEWQEVETIAKEKYRTDAWIYGLNPSFNLHKEKKFPGGLVEAYLHVRNNRLVEVRIFGDFFADKEITAVEKVLLDTPYEQCAIRKRLAGLNIEEYLYNISIDQLIDVLI